MFGAAEALNAKAKQASLSLQNLPALKQFSKLLQDCMADRCSVERVTTSVGLGTTLRDTQGAAASSQDVKDIRHAVNQLATKITEAPYSSDGIPKNLMTAVKSALGIFLVDDFVSERALLESVESLEDAYLSMQKLKDSGADIPARLMAHDGARHPLVMATFVKLKLAKDKAAKVKMDNALFVAALDQAIGVVEFFVSEHVECMKQNLLQKLVEKRDVVVEVSGACLGNTQGAGWKGNLGPGATGGDMLGRAGNTIMALSGGMLEQGIANYRYVYLTCKEFEGLYSIGDDRMDLQAHDDVLAEVCLLALEANVILSYKLLGQDKKQLRKALSVQKGRIATALSLLRVGSE